MHGNTENSNATVPARSTSGWTWHNPLDNKGYVWKVQNGLSRDSAQRIQASYACSLLNVMSHDCYSGITICYPGIAAIGWNCIKHWFCVADTSFWSTRHQFILIIDNIICRTRAHHNIVCSVENKINDRALCGAPHRAFFTHRSNSLVTQYSSGIAYTYHIYNTCVYQSMAFISRNISKITPKVNYFHN